MERMYHDAKTWNPFKGCYFGCVYCKPSFQAIEKRYNRKCEMCREWMPHEHPERLDPKKMPRSKIIFVCGNGDLAWATQAYRKKIYDTMMQHSIMYPNTEYYLQSKNPSVFIDEELYWPPSTWVGTTIETDMSTDKYSKAPHPAERGAWLKMINWHKKFVTIEPIMAMDYQAMLGMMLMINPKRIYIGYNSKPKQVKLPEPDSSHVATLVSILRRHNFEIIFKDMRDGR